MANSDKNILITPNKGLSGLPDISFTGFGNTTISLKVPDGTTGSIRFESSGTSLFTIDTNQTGKLLSISGTSVIPYMDVDSGGTVALTPSNGSVNVSGDGIVLPGYETSALPLAPTPGLMVYDNTERVPKISDGISWTTLGKSIVKENLVFWVDISRKDCYNPYVNSTQVKDLASGFVGSFNSSPTFDYRDGGSLNFDGVDDFVSWDTWNNIAATSCTISVWINPSAIAYPNPPGGRSRGSAIGAFVDAYLGIIESTDGNISSGIHWAISSLSGRNNLSPWNGRVPPNKWTHLTGIYNGDENIVYQDGFFLGTVNQSGAIKKANTVWMGTYAGLTDSNHNFPGRIGEFQIYNRALTQGEIWRNYHATRERYGR